MWGGAFAARQISHAQEWDNAPGGTIVERYTDPLTEVEYILVEFKNSPGKYYVYYIA